MSQITKVEFWKDTGFQDGAVEVPSRNDTLPDPDATFEDAIKTSTDDFFSAFTIPVVFSDFLSMSYIRVTYEFNNADDEMIVYGWIDDISLKSDSEGSPSIHVAWHIDYWRTYFASARFGYGMVRNRVPYGTFQDPPQQCSYRYRLPGEYTSLAYKGYGQEAYWAVVNTAVESDDHRLTSVRTMVIPVSNKRNTIYYVKLGDTVAECPSIYDFVQGLYDEKLGLTSETVSSVYITPVPPLRVSGGDGTFDHPFEFDSSPSGSESEIQWATGRAQVRHATTIQLTRVSSDRSRITINFDDNTSEEHTDLYAVNYNWLADRYRTGDIGINTNVSGINYQLKLNGVGYSFLFISDIDTIARRSSSREFAEGEKFKLVEGSARVVSDLTSSYSFSGSTYTINFQGTLSDAIGKEYTYHNGTFGNDIIAVISGTETWYSDGTPVVSLLYDYQIGTNDLDGHTYGYMYSRNGFYQEFEQELPSRIMTEDAKEWVITDMECNPIGALPWGIAVQRYTVRSIISATSCYIEYRFNGKDSRASGLSFTIPVPAVDLTTNSFSSYVYSGQRDYDLEQRRVASQQALVSGVTSSLTGGFSNAVMASIGSSRGTTTTRTVPSTVGPSYTTTTKTPGRGISAPVAGLASVGLGIGASLAEYAVAQHYNGVLQKAEDMLQARQLDSIVTAGNGWDWFWNGRQCGMVSLVPDDYSLNRFYDDIEMNGVSVCEPTESCQNLFIYDGPYRIEELAVTGEIPPQARLYFRSRLADGVRIITKNDTTE